MNDINDMNVMNDFTPSIQFLYHTDEGHGWIEVYVSDLVKYDVVKDISRYSYVKGEKAYLEEDCDATVFLNKLKQNNVHFTIKELHRQRSPIRNYRSFNPLIIEIEANTY